MCPGLTLEATTETHSSSGGDTSAEDSDAASGLDGTMVAVSPARKRSFKPAAAAAGARDRAAESPLDTDNTLGLILSFVGKGNWLFVAGVSRKWRSIYASGVSSAGDAGVEAGPAAAGPAAAAASPAAINAASIQRTTFASALSTVPTLQMAHACGLNMDHLNERGIYSFCRAAGEVGSKEVLLWAREHGMRWNACVCGGATQQDRLAILRWLRLEQDCPWEIRFVARTAAERGMVTLLEWVMSQPDAQVLTNTYLSLAASAGGSVPVLEWLLARGALDADHLCTHAARYGQLAALQWLHERGITGDETTCNTAARRGDLPTLQWLRAQNTPWTEPDIAIDAAYSGNVAMLAWLQSAVATPWDAQCLQMMLVEAGEGGHLEAAKWLRAIGAPWPPAFWQVAPPPLSTMVGWQLATLQWARREGCPWGDWNSMVCELVYGMQPDVVDWAHKNGCPCECPRDAIIA